jgi:predicted DsbA family dithiol-disulfide isomerase
MGTNRPELRISVFSDYICPFCYIGSRRVLRLREEFNLRINWCGLEIHPDTPAQGMDMAQLGYPVEKWQSMMDGLQQLAQEENIRFGEHRFTTNSHKALRLAEAAKQAGRETFYSLHEALFHSCFVEGKNIGDESVLQSLAEAAGVSAGIVQSAWQDEQYRQRLDMNMKFAHELGISGTPAYVIGKQVLTGAQPYATLLDACNRFVRGA